MNGEENVQTEDAAKSYSEGLPEDRSLLIVDDDAPFLHRLARAMEARGFMVTRPRRSPKASPRWRIAPPAFAVVDLRLGRRQRTRRHRGAARGRGPTRAASC